MKIFISGKITGEPILACGTKFYEAEREIGMNGNFDLRLFMEGRKDRIVNPLYLKGIHFGISHEEAMKICLSELKTCDAIYMLKDWKQSEGAQLEYRKAKEWGKKVFFQK